MQVINEIAHRLRELREVNDYTAEQLCTELSLDLELYKGYENDGKDIPISLLYELANKFGVDFTEIVTGQPGRLQTYQIVKQGKGKILDRNPEYHFQDLAYRYGAKIMQPLLVTLEPTDKKAALVTHSGQEFNMVLEGKIHFQFGEKEFLLEAGDSIYFNPTIAHGQACASETTARFLTIITE